MDDPIVKTGYWLHRSHQRWLQRIAYERTGAAGRQVTQSEVLREIVEKAIRACPNGHAPATEEVTP